SYALIGLPAAEYPTRFIAPDETTSKYSILIASDKFGCGFSREHAPVVQGAVGVAAMIAESYAKIFFRNSVATGEVYPLESGVRVCEACRTGDVVTIELGLGRLINHTTGKDYRLKQMGFPGRTGDVVTIELGLGRLINHTTRKDYGLKPIGDTGPVIEAGWIFAYARKAGMIPSLAA
ncbi:hypothetical protein C3L33_23399, partial [Rhododendron williamsianum]